ncbi:MAG: DnaJ domain-containing protein [Armatimonadetes bacterium]|nr:DnaJ domain-containing protein [Armatimonadota bacterium]MBS1726763.1 DnaJ domain-containing protein [Armatimonadota bacterium]
MAQDHYRTLGVSRNATAAEIKSAYRKIALAHHPDRSQTLQSSEIFLKATEAYEVLGDPDRRKQYDVFADAERRRPTQTPPTQTQTQPKPQPKPQSRSEAKVSTIAADVTKLTLIFTRGQYNESEKLARQILQKDGKQPIPYAVLGDIARAKGNLDEAAKMYAYAAQMDPRNPIYQQRHEELIRTHKPGRSVGDAATKASQKSVMTAIVGVLLVLSSALYVMLANEPAIAPGISLVSTWTLGLAIMLFLSGVSAGAVLCAGNYIDRFNASTVTATGKVSSPIVTLTTVAIVNFWAAAALYGAVCIAQRGYTYSHLRFVVAIAVTTLVMVGASALSVARFEPGQVLLWGGNITYLGGICGWMVADSFKRI